MNNYKQEQHILFLTIMGVSLLLSAYARHQVLIYGADRFTSIITFIFSLLILYAGFLLIRSLLYEVIQLFLKPRKETVPQAPSLVAEVVSEDTEPVKPSSESSFNYSEHKKNTLELRLQEEQERVNAIITYSQKTLTPYISEAELKTLCDELRLFLTSRWNQDEAQSVTISSELKTIDLMHFGWNIAQPFKIPRKETALFLKKTFPKALYDVEVSTIQRKLTNSESKSLIPLQENIINEEHSSPSESYP